MISLYVEDGIAYVWNSEDWFELRTKHRICGSLIGSISSYPRQNDFLGLPLALMAEEAAMLVENGICDLYSIPSLAKEPSEENKKTEEALQKKLLAEQSEALRKRRIEQISQKIDIITAGKKKKMKAKGLSDISLDKQTLLQEEINKLPPLASVHVLVHLPTQHWLDAEQKKLSIKDLKPDVTSDGAIKFAIYKDLWEQGFFISEGMKFGCDYLVYPGDPVKFHAMNMVKCISDQAATFQPASLVAFGRLSIAVNKLAVLATQSNDGQIHYQTLQWHDSLNG